MTDYFLEKSQLTTECVKISTELSKKLNTTVNCSINYKLLYAFIGKVKHKLPVKDIDQLLSELRGYIQTHYLKFMNNYLQSRDVTNRHQIFMLNKFYSLKNQIPLEDAFSLTQLCYDTHLPSKKGLNEIIRGLAGEIKSERDNLNTKNMFFIQIYKSCFSSMVR